MFDHVLAALDPETNAQVGWTLLCPPSSTFSDTMPFIPLMLSRDKTGLIGAVGVDPSVSG
ncbi:hypothetical protein B0I35DRAFT_445533 [Stachybotrys elegans]|uniref:Uncharacterized protein n=1 Tax=Stachybotrys elegans TaxID=80388 RepID=A0A8K0SI05_9HYPO|nr:hypothetical protein B0I35DRAFT_445533 [Stachybotrys elegans]